MEQAVRCSFDLNISVLKFIGLYPSDSYRKLNRVYSITLYILAMMPSAILGMLHFVLIDEITDINYNDFIIAGMAFYSLKLLPFVKNGQRMKKCIHYFDDPDFAPKTAQHKRIIEECVSVCQRNSKVFFVGCIGGLSGFVGQAFYHKDQLPLNVWIPKALNEPTPHHILHLLLVIGAAYAVFACGAIDPLIGGLSHHAAAQFQVLKENLQHLDKHVDQKMSQFKSRDKTVRFELIYEEIKNCSRRYQNILKFVDEYETCFSPVVFVQFMESAITMGLCCLQISKMVVVNMDFLISINYLGVLFFQIFFYCYYGTLLIEESKTLSTAIYMSQWYDYNFDSQTALMILMEMTKRPKIVKAGKLVDLSLETFVTILKRAYSLLAILKNY